MTTPTNAPREPSPVRRGFTLTEVLISIALVLVLILGINQVFALTSRAVGAGQAVSSGTRSARAAESIMAQDIGSAVIERAPFFYIKSSTMAAFRNKVDRLADHDYNPANTSQVTVDPAVRTLDRNENGSDADPIDLTPRQFLTSRTHRVDILKMFVRSPARRQTGDGTSFSSDVTSNEQYILYGHLRQPENTNLPASVSGQGRDMGIGVNSTSWTADTNPNNFYASDWILGRFAFLLKEPESIGGNKVIRDRTGNNVTYYARGTNAKPTTLTPFAADTGTTITGPGLPTSAATAIQNTQYDIIGMSMERYRNEVLKPYTTANPITDPPDNNYAKPELAAWAANPNKMDFRPTGTSKPIRPLSRLAVSRTTPCFVDHCTQFVVEFAGDFLAQNPTTGAVTGVADGAGGGTDGEVDFIIDTVTKRKTIRWYGFPRDVNGDGLIRPDVDVVPVRDIAGKALAFERLVDSLIPKPTSATKDYDTDAAVPLTAAYYAVWGPDTDGWPRPKMLRITMAIDDPAGRIAEEQYFSFVTAIP